MLSCCLTKRIGLFSSQQSQGILHRANSTGRRHLKVFPNQNSCNKTRYWSHLNPGAWCLLFLQLLAMHAQWYTCYFMSFPLCVQLPLLDSKFRKISHKTWSCWEDISQMDWECQHILQSQAMQRPTCKWKLGCAQHFCQYSLPPAVASNP